MHEPSHIQSCTLKCAICRHMHIETYTYVYTYSHTITHTVHVRTCTYTSEEDNEDEVANTKMKHSSQMKMTNVKECS